MNSRRSLPLAALLTLLAATSSCAPRLSVPESACKASAATSAATLAEVNAYRRSRGLRTLEPHPGLTRLAEDHTRALLGQYLNSPRKDLTVHHAGVKGRMSAAFSDLGMIGFGENVAAVSSRPSSLPTHLRLLWQASPEHHRIMVGDYTHTGVAIAKDEHDTAFATQVFGKMESPAH